MGCRGKYPKWRKMPKNGEKCPKMENREKCHNIKQRFYHMGTTL